MPGNPVPHRRKIGAERQWDNIFWFADKDRTIAHAGMLFDMFDHLRIVIGRQQRLTFTAGRHWNVADEVGQPGQLGCLQLGVLVPVLIDVQASSAITRS